MTELFPLFWPLAGALLALILGRGGALGIYFSLALCLVAQSLALGLWSWASDWAFRVGRRARTHHRLLALLWALAPIGLWLALSGMMVSSSVAPWRGDLNWVRYGLLWLLPLYFFALSVLAPLTPQEEGFARFNLVVASGCALAAALWAWRGIDLFLPLAALIGVAWLWFSLQWILSFEAMLLSRFRGCEAYGFELALAPSKAFATDWLAKRALLDGHSLYSLSFLRRTLPTALCGLVLVCWYATSFVQVPLGSVGLVFRFGKVVDQVGSGLHLRLPWPLEQVALVDTQTVMTTPLGYESNGSLDFLWAESHASSELNLPLGGGSELVSANLKLVWKVSDAKAFLTRSASPIEELTSRALRLLSRHVARQNLDTLLSQGRAELAVVLASELKESLARDSLGIELVDVTLESLHPPVSIASTYQEVVSAGVRQKSRQLQAQGEYGAALLLAEADAQSLRDGALAEKEERQAQAFGEAALFDAELEGKGLLGEGYEVTKHLTTLEEVLPGHKLYILGPGVDRSKLVLSSRGAESLEPAWEESSLAPASEEAPATDESAEPEGPIPVLPEVSFGEGASDETEHAD